MPLKEECVFENVSLVVVKLKSDSMKVVSSTSLFEHENKIKTDLVYFIGQIFDYKFLIQL